MALATSGPEGLDCSRRGDDAQTVFVLDKYRLAIPDRRGNNRLDSLRNIMSNPSVALLFLIPGINETLRVNGDAYLSVAPDLIARFTVDGHAPKTVIVVKINAVCFQCGRALIRSKLWDRNHQLTRESLPTAGQIVAGTDPDFDGRAYDAELPTRQRKSLY